MDLTQICRNIYYAVYVYAVNAQSPLAYVNVRVGKDFPYSDEEFSKCFAEMKWDSPLSTADLNIIHDESFTDCLVQIEEITDFFDDTGRGNTYRVPDEDAKIG